MTTIFPDSGPVRLEIVAPHVALVTIDRETARNAVNSEVAKGLEQAVRAVDEDGTIRAAILTGAGTRSFCSGADLKEVAAGRIASFFTKEGGFAGFTRMPRRKPWIAAVNGYAFAGGFEIALACDMIMASEAASFALPEVKVGLVAGGGGAFRLPQKLPPHIATELLLTGAPLTAQQALALGLVNALSDPGRLISDAIDLAAKIAANSPSSVRQTLRILHAYSRQADEAAWLESDKAMAAAETNSDFVEGPRAFIERRAAIWRDEA